MNKDDITLIVVLAALGVGFYLYKNKQPAGAASAPAAQPTSAPGQTVAQQIGGFSGDVTAAQNLYGLFFGSNSTSSNSTSGVAVQGYADQSSVDSEG
jgi:hypothetical protein